MTKLSYWVTFIYCVEFRAKKIAGNVAHSYSDFAKMVTNESPCSYAKLVSLDTICLIWGYGIQAPPPQTLETACSGYHFGEVEEPKQKDGRKGGRSERGRRMRGRGNEREDEREGTREEEGKRKTPRGSRVLRGVI